jgi:hypothetical protein
MNNFKTCFALLLLVSSMNLVSAQKLFKGQLTFSNNTTLECLVDVPHYPSDKYVKYKLSETSDIRKIKSDSISRITITSDDGSQYTLIRMELSKKEGWNFCILVLEGYANLYLTGDGISTDKHGNVSPTSSFVSGRSMPEFYYMIKRKNEKYLTTIAITSPSVTMFGKARAFRKMASEYFVDWPELVERIKNEEFTEKDVEKVVKLYNQHMDSK